MRRLNKACAIAVCLVALPYFCAAQDSGISEESSRQSSEDSLQQSTENSSEATTQSSTDNSEGSFQESSRQSTAQSTEQTSASDSVVLTSLIIAGAVVSVGITVGGVIMTIRASGVRAEEALGLQDQIYAAEGKDFALILDRFEIGEATLVGANDETVMEGHLIEDNQSAAEYLAALILKAAEASPWVRAERGLPAI